MRRNIGVPIICKSGTSVYPSLLSSSPPSSSSSLGSLSLSDWSWSKLNLNTLEFIYLFDFKQSYQDEVPGNHSWQEIKDLK